MVEAGGAGRIAQVVTVPERSMVTMDMREDRVRIVATRDGNVASVPIVGYATTAICTTLQHSCISCGVVGKAFLSWDGLKR